MPQPAATLMLGYLYLNGWDAIAIRTDFAKAEQVTLLLYWYCCGAIVRRHFVCVTHVYFSGIVCILSCVLCCFVFCLVSSYFPVCVILSCALSFLVCCHASCVLCLVSCVLCLLSCLALCVLCFVSRVLCLVSCVLCLVLCVSCLVSCVSCLVSCVSCVLCLERGEMPLSVSGCDS